MPELPEVETVVRQLRPQLVGATIARVELPWRGVVSRPAPEAFRRGLAHRRIEGLGRRGKYLLFALDDGRHLVGHLRMTGRLHVGRRIDDAFARARLHLVDGRELVFADVRKFGRLALVRDPAEALPELGPEPLSDVLTGPWLARALRSHRRRLKPLLLDQSFLAGLGNIYVDESLHRAGLHPLRLSHRVTRPQAEALAAAIGAVLRSAIAADGSSFDAFYRTPEGRPGRFQDEFAVYGRAGQPCRRCATTIVRLNVGQRGTHVCPRCQRAPRQRA